ncbi:hypothetical protein [Proteus mirabilis]|uniref:hypothetical protein n=1 Tax=Proteus mirabilis TaxID=584 RepID=UPI0035574058
MLFYRYTNYYDEDGFVYIKQHTYKMVRETPCFYIVKEEFQSSVTWLLGREYRVPKNPDKCRRIHHTLKSAWHSFLIRQERRIMHAELNLKLAKESIKYIKKNNAPIATTKLKRGFFS